MPFDKLENKSIFMMKMEFYKVVASGNDFVVIDNRGKIIKRGKDFAVKVCDRKFGVGADGLILVEDSKICDFKMRMFNPDGSEAEMCGNGLRCLIRFLREKGISRKRKFLIEAKAGIYECEINGENVKVWMKVIGKPNLYIEIPLNRKKLKGHYIDSGVPHTVIFTKDVGKVNIEKIGPLIRYHEIFKPRGTNVDFVEVLDKGRIKIRTYERGVEKETLSCGTGVVAGAVISFLLKKVNSPVKVITASGDTLKVGISDDLKKIYLEGKTFISFWGEYPYK